MKIDITAFDGIRPRIGAHLLENGQATIARNCRLGSGMLKPLGTMVQAEDEEGYAIAVPDSVRSMYRWQGEWLFYEDWRSFVPGPAKSSADESEGEDDDVTVDEVNERRLFMSAENGGLYVYRSGGNAAWKLGVPAPNMAPNVETTTAAKTSATKESRTYVYTYVNTLGQESAPSPASSVIDVQGQTVRVSGLNGDVAGIAAQGYCPIQYIRIYRLAVGNEGAGYLYVKQVKSSTAGTTDKVADSKLGEALPSLGWRVPSQKLKMLTGAGNNGYAAFDGNELRFSQPLYPYAWPDALSHVLEYEIVGIARSSVHLYVFTKGPVYYMSLEDVTASVPVKMEGIYPCLSARGIVSVPGGCVFPCQDGLYFVGAGYSKPFRLTAGYFDEPQWAGLWPKIAFGAYSNGSIFYVLDGERWEGSTALLMKLGINEGGNAGIQNLTTTDAPIRVAYASDDDGFLYAITQGGNAAPALMRWEGHINEDTGTPEQYRAMDAVWQSKSYITGNKVNFSCAIVEQDMEDDPVHDADGTAVQDELAKLTERHLPAPYTRVIFYRNGKEFYRKEITDREAFVLPAGFTGRTLQMRLETDRAVRRIAVAESMAELFA